MNNPELPVRPLDGILVVAIEQAVAAPLCTARLVDAGARVIKIERESGDFARDYDNAALGDSSYFAWTNHGKESVVLDFRNHDDAALLHRIIAKADIFIQNLAPGATTRAGFGSSQLRQRNPRLISCDISGYGESPELGVMKAYDLLVQAESGLVSVSGATGEYGRIGVSLCDIGAGVTAHAGILEALLLRAQTHEGSSIAVSLFDVAAEWMTVPLVHAETGEGAPQRVGLRHPSIAPYGAFPTNDEKLTLISIQNEREWHRLCQSVLNQTELMDDHRFNSNQLRVSNRVVLEQSICSITRTMSSDELRHALQTASLAYGALNSVNDLAEHAALRRRTVVNSLQQSLSIPAHPVLHKGSNTLKAGSESKQSIPVVGQHTDSVREEFSAGR